jgi:hypothetical protein
MLKLKVVLSEDFDEAKQEFVTQSIDIELEHSLASLSKWETIWEIPLLSSNDKTEEQNFSYLECMCLTPNVAPEVFKKLNQEQQDQIAAFLDKKHSATWFNSSQPEAKSGEAITAELVYYWMSSFRIDWEAQYWNLNKLLTLVKVFSVKQDNKPKRMSARSRQADIARINAQRRAELGTKG